MKTILLSSLLCLGSLSLQAADYRLTTVAHGTWDTLNWQLDPGPGSGVPGAEDSVLDISGGTINIRLNGDRTVVDLGKTGGNNTRILNTNGQDDTLTVTGNMNVSTGTFLFRSEEEGRLTINVEGNLYLGTNNPADSANGRLTFGDNASYRNVSMTVAGMTVVQGYAGGIIFNTGATAADTQVHLGRLIFDLPTLASGSPSVGVTLTPGTLVSVSSIESTANDTRSVFTGVSDELAGRVRIDGEGGAFIYSGRFLNHIAIEKVGGSVQVFSRANGNSHTGGTLVTKGTLAVTNTSGSGLGSGAVEVRDEGKLAGSGLVRLAKGNRLTVKSGGAIAPGEADRLMNPESQSFQQLTLDGLYQTALDPVILEMQEGSSFLFRIDENGGSDSLHFRNYQAGGLLLAEGGIRIDITGELAVGTTYTLMTFSADSGLEEGLVMGSGFGNYIATFHYDDTRKVTMTIAAIPEPSTVALLLISGLGAWLLRRRTCRFA